MHSTLESGGDLGRYDFGVLLRDFNIRNGELRILDMELLLQNLRQISNTLASSANYHSGFRGIYYDSRADGALCQLDMTVPGAFQL